jgi:hypothetical protein
MQAHRADQVLAQTQRVEAEVDLDADVHNVQSSKLLVAVACVAAGKGVQSDRQKKGRRHSQSGEQGAANTRQCSEHSTRMQADAKNAGFQVPRVASSQYVAPGV